MSKGTGAYRRAGEVSGPAGRPIEGDVSDRENAHGQKTRFQNAPGCNP